MFAVMIEVELGEIDYIRDTEKSYWCKDDPVKIFHTREEARKEADKWNTGQVIVWNT